MIQASEATGTTVADQRVTVRDATPADAEFLAWVMLTAARSHLERGVWDHLMGTDEQQVLEFLAKLAVSGPDHLFRYSRFIIAEVDGQPAAALSGYDPTAHGMEVYMPVAISLVVEGGASDAELNALMERGTAIVSAFTEAPENCWIVESVATAPAFRRMGLVDTLLEEILRRGRDAGFTTSKISVFIGNEPARAAYVKHGYQSVEEKRTPEWEAAIGCPGLEHFRLPLASSR